MILKTGSAYVGLNDLELTAYVLCRLTMKTGLNLNLELPASAFYS